MCARINCSDKIAEYSNWPHDDMYLKRINHINFIFEAAILPEKKRMYPTVGIDYMHLRVFAQCYSPLNLNRILFGICTKMNHQYEYDFAQQ